MKRIVLVIASLLSIVAVALPVISLAQTPKQSVCEGVGFAGSGGNDCAPQGGPSVESTISNAINLISILVGVAAIIMIIIGGLKYITSAGDSSKVNSAKDTILFAIIGLVVALLAQVIVKFVVTRFG